MRSNMNKIADSTVMIDTRPCINNRVNTDLSFRVN